MASLQLTGVIPFIVSFLLYIFIGPVFLVLLLLNELARLIVSIYLYLKYEGEVTLVPDGKDGVWACKMPGRNRTVSAGVKVGPGLDFESLICLLEDMMAYKTSDGRRCYEKLEYILTTKAGYACWKRDNQFSVRNHCRVISENTVCTEADVKRTFKELSEDLDESHPQWEFVLIPRYKEKGKPISTLMCLRFLHAYFDGLSINMLLKNMSSNYTPYFDPLKFHFPLLKRILFYTNAVIFSPFALLQLARSYFKSHWPTLQDITPDEQIERNFTWTDALNIDRIKPIKNGVRSKISVSTIVENAFISAAIGTLPRKRIPDEWGILEVVALVPYPNENPQNRFSGFAYSVNTLDDDFTRLEKTSKDVNEGLTGPSIVLAFAGATIGGRLPVRILEYALPGGLSAMVYSNLPGSRTQATLRVKNNVEILEILAFPPQPNDTGITVLGFAYQNRLKLSVSALSNWLTKEELEAIVAKIPGVIESWAAKADKLQEECGGRL